MVDKILVCLTPNSLQEVLRFSVSIIALALISASSLHAEMDSLMIDGTALRLIERDAACLIEHDGTVLAVGLPAPCRFLRRGVETEPAVHRYDRRGSVVLVAGPLAHPDDYSRIDYLSPSD